MNRSVTSTEPACDYCGLPIAQTWWKSSKHSGAESSAPQYCCFGCRLAADITRERGETGRTQWTAIRLGLSIFFTMNVMAFTMTLWSRDLYTIDNDPAWTDSLADVLRYICLLCALPVLLLLGLPLFANAWTLLRSGRFSTDFLIVLGVTAAYGMSVHSVMRGAGPVYFEVGCMVLVFVTLGRWLEASARVRATQAIDELERLLPSEACRIGHGGTEEIPIDEFPATGTSPSAESRETQRIPLDEIQPGDWLRIAPGERFPVDGRLVTGQTAVDQQILTGESEPVIKHPGDRVWAGTLNVDGHVTVTAHERAGAGSFWKLLDMVRAARDAQSLYERNTERWSRWFVPAVVVIAFVTSALHGAQRGGGPALLAGLSVLLISCPCALGLATPLAVCTAAGRAVRRQVLFRDGDALERLAEVDAVLFDKTGTLTTGLAAVEELLVDESAQRDAVLAAAGQLAAHSPHPFSVTIAQFARTEPSFHAAAANNVASIDADSVRTLPGRGIEAHATSTGDRFCLGRPDLFPAQSWACSPTLQAEIEACLREARPLAVIGWNQTVQGVFRFRETLREDAGAVLRQLHDDGFELAVLTGDHVSRGKRLEQQLGQAVYAGLLPEEKVSIVRSTQQRGRHVAMVGDGVNDAPALAASDVGIALGCGTDISRDSAAVCLLSNDLTQIPWAIQLSRQTSAVIRQNLLWAFGYNSLGIGLAAAGWLNPAVAAGLMVVSSLFVIGNTLRLNGGDAGAAVAVRRSSSVEQENARLETSPAELPGSRVDHLPTSTADSWDGDISTRLAVESRRG